MPSRPSYFNRNDAFNSAPNNMPPGINPVSARVCPTAGVKLRASSLGLPLPSTLPLPWAKPTRQRCMPFQSRTRQLQRPSSAAARRPHHRSRDRGDTASSSTTKIPPQLSQNMPALSAGRAYHVRNLAWALASTMTREQRPLWLASGSRAPGRRIHSSQHRDRASRSNSNGARTRNHGARLR
jgi:hypothetical protein